MISRDEIRKMIPHREPFLFLDRIEALEPGVRCTAWLALDTLDAIFAGHFPARPIVPGVLLIEAIAQTAAVMMAATATSGSVDDTLLAAVNRFKLLRPVLPGQQVRLETSKLTEAGRLAYIGGTVTVDGTIVATGELSIVCA